MTSEISLWNGSTWLPTTSSCNHILVIADGAGVRQNEIVYRNLIDQGYELDIVHAGNRSFEYPKYWHLGNPISHNMGVPTLDLAGFGHEVGIRIRKRPPSLIICGSRGGQVTLGVVLRHYWRGPFISMNAGPMTSQTPIPPQAFACFLTFGQDYFQTSQNKFTVEKFQELASSGQRGLLIHLANETHMPTSRALHAVLSHYIQIGQSRATTKDIQRILWKEQSMIILQLTQGRPPEEVWKY